MVTIQGHSGLIEGMRAHGEEEKLNWAPTLPPPHTEKKSQREGTKAAIIAVLADWGEGGMEPISTSTNYVVFFATFVLWLCGQI